MKYFIVGLDHAQPFCTFVLLFVAILDKSSANLALQFKKKNMQKQHLLIVLFGRIY